jgi:hypothetical protein
VTNSFIEVTDGLSTGDELAMDAYQRGLLEFGDSEGEEADADAPPAEPAGGPN